MTREDARIVLGRYRPCEHENADTSLGDGKTWAKCENCGATFQQSNWQKARDAAVEFDRALETLVEGEGKLTAYSKEIGMDFLLSVDQLVESHRRLREELMRVHRPKIQAEHEALVASIRENVIATEFTSNNRLREMTIAQLVAHLGG